jgi:hypothetical protein
VVAEICVGDIQPDTVAERIRSWGVAIVDLPAASAPVRAAAFAPSCTDSLLSDALGCKNASIMMQE